MLKYVALLALCCLAVDAATFQILAVEGGDTDLPAPHALVDDDVIAIWARRRSVCPSDVPCYIQYLLPCDCGHAWYNNGVKTDETKAMLGSNGNLTIKSARSLDAGDYWVVNEKKTNVNPGSLITVTVVRQEE